MRPSLLLTSLCLPLLTACQSSGTARDDASIPTPAEAPVLTLPDTPEPALPENTIEPPYTAAQIAFSHPVGAFTIYRLTADGNAMLRRTEWTLSTDERCEMVDQVTNLDGAPMGEPTSSGAEWWELRNHAAMPIASTSVSPESIEIEAGRFDCQKFRTEESADGVATVTEMWFDARTAGSPLLFVQTVNGREMMRMEMVEFERRALPGS